MCQLHTPAREHTAMLTRATHSWKAAHACRYIYTDAGPSSLPHWLLFGTDPLHVCYPALLSPSFTGTGHFILFDHCSSLYIRFIYLAHKPPSYVLYADRYQHTLCLMSCSLCPQPYSYPPGIYILLYHLLYLIPLHPSITYMFSSLYMYQPYKLPHVQPSFISLSIHLSVLLLTCASPSLYTLFLSSLSSMYSFLLHLFSASYPYSRCPLLLLYSVSFFLTTLYCPFPIPPSPTPTPNVFILSSSSSSLLFLSIFPSLSFSSSSFSLALTTAPLPLRPLILSVSPI